MLFKENTTKLCGCSNPKDATEIYCHDCANFWQSTLASDRLPFANDNSKVVWMNDTVSHWAKLVQNKMTAGAIG